MKNETVKEFWDSMAEKHGSSDLATAPDQYYRRLEIDSIIDAIAPLEHTTILDVGCGNGFTTKALAQVFPESIITGIDYSEAMIAEAQKDPVDEVHFFLGDVLDLSHHPELVDRHFDVVLSTRCLINLTDWNQQKTAIWQMQSRMARQGSLILVENCKEGLANLNRLRDRFGLQLIKERWHNCLLSKEELIPFLYDQGLVLEHRKNIGNMYYIASRVIYAKLCQEIGKEPDYNNPINKIACQLPTMGEDNDYSPNYIFVCREPTHVQT